MLHYNMPASGSEPHHELSRSAPPDVWGTNSGAEKKRQMEARKTEAKVMARVFRKPGEGDTPGASSNDGYFPNGGMSPELVHKQGLCKPCAWFHHASGCKHG